jgi:hypothetical protein
LNFAELWLWNENGQLIVPGVNGASITASPAGFSGTLSGACGGLVEGVWGERSPIDAALAACARPQRHQSPPMLARTPRHTHRCCCAGPPGAVSCLVARSTLTVTAATAPPPHTCPPPPPPPFSAAAGGIDLQLGVNVTGNVGYNPYTSWNTYGYHSNPCSITAFFQASFPSQRIAQYWLFNRAWPALAVLHHVLLSSAALCGLRTAACYSVCLTTIASPAAMRCILPPCPPPSLRTAGEDGSTNRPLINGYRVQLRDAANTVLETVGVNVRGGGGRAASRVLSVCVQRNLRLLAVICAAAAAAAAHASFVPTLLPCAAIYLLSCHAPACSPTTRSPFAALRRRCCRRGSPARPTPTSWRAGRTGCATSASRQRRSTSTCARLWCVVMRWAGGRL